MCQKQITKAYNVADNLSGEGWKVVAIIDKLIFSECQHNCWYPSNEWIDDVCRPMLTASRYGDPYQSGFHIFENEEDAVVWQNRFCLDILRAPVSSKLSKAQYQKLLSCKLIK